jgi:hypothetical protein
MSNDLQVQNISLAQSQLGLTLEELADTRNRMVAIVKSNVMVRDVHYGIIPGSQKNSLLKPGAEMLCMLFGLTAEPEVVDSVLDWTGKDSGCEPLFYVKYRTSITRNGKLICKKDGSSNSREKKYRWRWVPEIEVPANLDKSTLQLRDSSLTEFTFAINKAVTSGQYGKPVEYWQKFNDEIEAGTAVKSMRKMGKQGDESEAYTIKSRVYRVPNEEIPDLLNTIEKISEKRSLINAVLHATGASEFYTQDLEDFTEFMPPQAEVKVESKKDLLAEVGALLAAANANQKTRISAARNAIFGARVGKLSDWTDAEAKLLRDAAKSILADLTEAPSDTPPQSPHTGETKPVAQSPGEAANAPHEAPSGQQTVVIEPIPQSTQSQPQEQTEETEMPHLGDEVYKNTMAKIAIERKRIWKDTKKDSEGDKEYRAWLLANHGLTSAAGKSNETVSAILADLKNITNI